MGRLVKVLLALVIPACFAGCGGSDECIILVNGGNKLCGNDAVAWCEASDPMREIAEQLANADVDEAVRRTHAACDEIRGVPVSSTAAPTRTPDPDWTATPAPTASPTPVVDLHVYRLIRGAKLDDELGDAMIFTTSRSSVTISGAIEPDQGEVDLLRARGNGGKGWEPGSRRVTVRAGEFTVRVSLRPGENNFKLVGSSAGSEDDLTLVAIVRR